MAAARVTKKAIDEDELLAKAIALSLEEVEGNQIRKAIDLSLNMEKKPVVLSPSNNAMQGFPKAYITPSMLEGVSTSIPTASNPSSLKGFSVHPTNLLVQSKSPSIQIISGPSQSYRTMKRPDGECIADFRSIQSKLSPKDRIDAEKSLLGTVTFLNIEKSFGFIAASKPLPKEYKGKSLFFHFDIVKNLSEKPVTLQRGSTVKFVPYKGSFDKPKSYAVFLLGQSQGPHIKNKKKVNSKAKDGVKQNIKMKNSPELNQIKKQLKNEGPPKKVSIFWDIENCRPKKNTILQVVGKIRELVLQGQQVLTYLLYKPILCIYVQEQSFMVVCDVTEESKEVISSLEDANVSNVDVF